MATIRERRFGYVEQRRPEVRGEPTWRSNVALLIPLAIVVLAMVAMFSYARTRPTLLPTAEPPSFERRWLKEDYPTFPVLTPRNLVLGPEIDTPPPSEDETAPPPRGRS